MKIRCKLGFHKYEQTTRDYLVVEKGDYKVIQTPCERCKCGKFSPQYTKQQWAKAGLVWPN